MSAPTLPKAFRLLAGQRNLSVESAIVTAIPQMEPELRAAAVELILERGHHSGLAALIEQFTKTDTHLQDLLIARIGDLYAGVRMAITSSKLQTRLGGIELIERACDTKLAYLLGTALRSRCPRTRERSSLALHHMTARVLHQRDDLRKAATRSSSILDAEEAADIAARLAKVNKRLEDLAETLRHAIKGWEIHHQIRVLQAALWLGDRVEQVMSEKLSEPRSGLDRAVGSLMLGMPERRMAGAMLQALIHEKIRPAAVSGLSRTNDMELLEAVSDECWLLADQEIRQGCLRLREMNMMNGALGLLSNLPPRKAANVIRLIGASGVRGSRKGQYFLEALALDVEEINQAVIWQLVSEPADWATDVLRIIGHREKRISRIARREIKNRRAVAYRMGIVQNTSKSAKPAAVDVPDIEADASGTSSLAGGTERRAIDPDSVTAAMLDELPVGDDDPITPEAKARELWDAFWHAYDEYTPAERLPAARRVKASGQDLLVKLRAKLASSQPIDRARALRMVNSLSLSRPLAERIYELTNDDDAIVRSAAISQLRYLPGITSERILRRAIHDEDQRVQANAVQALDELNSPDRTNYLRPKLSSKHSRVRANAVKALLRLELEEAASVLLDMLSDSSRSHRISALWVVERLRLASIIDRIQRMEQRDPDPSVKQRAARVMRSLLADTGLQKEEAMDDGIAIDFNAGLSADGRTRLPWSAEGEIDALLYEAKDFSAYEQGDAADATDTAEGQGEDIATEDRDQDAGERGGE